MVYFNIEMDNETVSAGGFFCEACLMGKPSTEQAPDQRYCQGCFEVLSKEADLLPPKKRPKWVPKSPKISPQKTIPVPQHVVLNMSIVKHEKTSMDIIQPLVREVTLGKRGPKFTELPDDLITQWAGEGMGARAISTKLEKEYQVITSYKIIQRRLQLELVK